MTNESEFKQGAQTVDRALDLLAQMTFEHPSHTLTELSERTGLTLSTTHRLLKALVRRGFVSAEPATRRYGVGPAVLRLAGILLERESLTTAAIPHVRSARDETTETAALHWLVDLHRVPVVEFESPHPLRMTSGIGRTYPLSVGAAGKAILAWLGDADRALVLSQRHTEDWPGTSQTDSEFEEELSAIRERGYAMSSGEVVEGASAIAVAVKEADGYPVASLNITGPRDRWVENRMTEFAPRLIELGLMIENRVTGSSDEATVESLGIAGGRG